MSHSRVSLGRIAIPCITGGVEGRPGAEAREVRPSGPRPGLQGAPLLSQGARALPSAIFLTLPSSLPGATGLRGSRARRA